MKIKKILDQYKIIVSEAKREAANYRSLREALESRSIAKDTFEKYQNSWRRLIRLNETAYRLMYEYRRLAGTLRYRLLFFVGIVPSQNSFRFIEGSETHFRCSLLVNMLTL